MKEHQFDKLVIKYFSEILEPEGFDCVESRHSTFYRKTSDDIFHIVLADLSTDGTWFDIKVFATSPLIEPRFSHIFPDDLGVTSDSFCYLHPVSGVGPDQKIYRCKTEEGFIRNYRGDVESALRDKALPFLKDIKTLSDLVPYIRHDFYLGAALMQIGEKDEGMQLLKSEADRLSQVHDTTGRTADLLAYIEQTTLP